MEINLNKPDIFLEHILNLDRIELVDDVPNIQFTPLSIVVEPTSLQNPISYADHSAFITQFGSEMEQIAKIDSIVEHGQHFVHMLYTFRSVSNALPMVVSSFIHLLLYSLFLCLFLCFLIIVLLNFLIYLLLYSLISSTYFFPLIYFSTHSYTYNLHLI